MHTSLTGSQDIQATRGEVLGIELWDRETAKTFQSRSANQLISAVPIAPEAPKITTHGDADISYAININYFIIDCLTHANAFQACEYAFHLLFRLNHNIHAYSATTVARNARRQVTLFQC